jgi:hypothetical protein
MDAPKEVPVSGLASTEDDKKPADHVPDPSASFLERKERLRAEAASQAPQRLTSDQRGNYRGNTSSGAWLPLLHGRGK